MLEYVLPTLLALYLARSEFEVLVCDLNFTHGTAEFLARMRTEHSNVRHLPGAYSGRAAARNAGIAAAQGEVVLSRTTRISSLRPDCSRSICAIIERREASRSSASKCKSKTSQTTHTSASIPRRAGFLHKPTRTWLPWLYFLTGNASVWCGYLLRVGCFDESFTGHGHEDLELGYRLERAGVTILYEPKVVNHHCQDVPHDDQKE